MDIIDTFQKTLIMILESQPRGSKTRLADDLGIARTNLSAYLSGRDKFSEQRKEQIAEYLGFSYIEFLQLGNRLFQSDDPWLWALRFIYQDEKRFLDLVNDSNISQDRFSSIFSLDTNSPLLPAEKEQILEASGFSKDDFIKLGQREILKNPKMKWDMGVVDRFDQELLENIKNNKFIDQPHSNEDIINISASLSDHLLTLGSVFEQEPETSGDTIIPSVGGMLANQLEIIIRLTKYMKEVITLRRVNEELRKDLKTVQEKNSLLVSQITKQEAQILELGKKIKDLN